MKVTVAQAIEITGLPGHVIRKDIRTGRLETQLEKHISKQGRLVPMRVIDEADLAAYQVTRSVRAYRKWSEADECALVELYRTCSMEQLSTYLRRTLTEVRNKLLVMQRHGWEHHREKANTYSAFTPSSTCVLVAKTCTKCGKFRSASKFGRYKDRPHGRAACHDCRFIGQRDRRREFDLAAKQMYEAKQSLTSGLATRAREPYTDADMKVLENTDISPLEAALKLKRSYAAVTCRRSQCGITTRADAPDWHIRFPNAAKALQEYYAKHAKPPEDWEWDSEPWLQEVAR